MYIIKFLYNNGIALYTVRARLSFRRVREETAYLFFSNIRYYNLWNSFSNEIYSMPVQVWWKDACDRKKNWPLCNMHYVYFYLCITKSPHDQF